MAIFTLDSGKAKKLEINKFKNEKELQNLCESNLDEIFGVTFLATEFRTTHGGRIDTIGLDENNSPVIIEYKQDKKDNVLNQALFYLDWLIDHKADFELLVKKNFSDNTEVNWAEPRVIILAKSYNEYDKYAINRISDKIELWKYVLYKSHTLLVERVTLPRSSGSVVEKAKKFREHKEYDVGYHLEDKPESIKVLFNSLREKILDMDDQINERIRKHYIAYSLDKNFAGFVVQSGGIWVHIDLPKEDIVDSKGKFEDVSAKGHWCTGGMKMKVESEEDIDYIMPIIKESYESRL
jgi:predicted transport protein